MAVHSDEKSATRAAARERLAPYDEASSTLPP